MDGPGPPGAPAAGTGLTVPQTYASLLPKQVSFSPIPPSMQDGARHSKYVLVQVVHAGLALQRACVYTPLLQLLACSALVATL